MVLSPQHTSVLIIGAGPSGLMMAAQLLRNGIQPVIIDHKQGPTPHSNALLVQARSLEIYRQMGIIDSVLKNGNTVPAADFYLNGGENGNIDFSGIGDSQTKFPFLFVYPQSKNERALIEYLTFNCCPIYWNTNLISLIQDNKQVEVTLQSGGTTVTLTCNWLIGADGANSTVRDQLQISFTGDTRVQEFYVADVELDNPELNKNHLQVFLAKNQFAGILPMHEAKHFRIMGNLPARVNKQHLQLDAVLPFLNQVTGLTLNLVDDSWFTFYQPQHGMANQFRKQRCFLIGDAAHSHSPLGGQGMNTGLQDAYNLAWKLAGVINHQLNESILNSYTDERIPLARTLLNTTDRAFSLITSTNWFMALLKKWILPKLLNRVFSDDAAKSTFFKKIAQTDISYLDSKVNLHLSTATKIKAGDRLPYLKIFDEKKQQETDLHEWCNKPGFTFIALGNLSDLDLFTLAKWLTQNYPSTVNFFYLPPSTKNRLIFEGFEIRKGQKKAVIVRPDMHIGFINDVVDIEMMDNYLRNVVGLL